ncbi:MAG: chorismate-binding protein [Bdellovibrionaceae bacterium]|nr:chorismate-binding protein [Pseudobdellovibrionaceae bacterium]
MQPGTLQNGIAARQTANEFGPSETAKFLASGWIVSLSANQFAIGWGAGHWQSSPPMMGGALFAPDFYMTRADAWWVSEGTAFINREQLLEKLRIVETTRATTREATSAELSLSGSALSGLDWVEPAYARFSTLFTHLQSEFRAGRAHKAVPVVFSRARGTGGSFATRQVVEQAIRVAEGPLRLYGWWTQTEGILGLSPELLFSIENSRDLQTMALAGTRRGRLSEAEQIAFLADPKERTEHQWVVDDLRERLSRFGRVEIGTTTVLQLPTLAHLHTPIRVRAERTLDMSTVVQALHPTPALGYAPRSLGMDWMKSWDQEPQRERFGAPFGVQWLTESGPRSECLVAIRNVQWSDIAGEREWRLGAGCGLVEQSVLENEWRELAAKRDSVRQLLGL